MTSLNFPSLTLVVKDAPPPDHLSIYDVSVLSYLGSMRETSSVGPKFAVVGIVIKMRQHALK